MKYVVVYTVTSAVEENKAKKRVSVSARGGHGTQSKWKKWRLSEAPKMVREREVVLPFNNEIIECIQENLGGCLCNLGVGKFFQSMTLKLESRKIKKGQILQKNLNELKTNDNLR